VRVVTAAALFDGHDAAIHVVRRILQAQGAEVIHLGHDRSVAEIVQAALQEDAQAIAVSSYQGGHMELFRYLIDSLRAQGAGHVKVFGGGGGTILPEEVEALHQYGVTRIFTPQDGQRMGLVGMIGSVLDSAGEPPMPALPAIETLDTKNVRAVAQLITWLERTTSAEPTELTESQVAELARVRAALSERAAAHKTFVLGLTGTGGAGKSSVLDELLLRLMKAAPELRVGLLLVDPSKRRSRGALLGDRIRINALSLYDDRLYARSMATRRLHSALSTAVQDAVLALRAASYDLIVLETAGIGQGDSEIIDLCDASMYVMTPEYGAPSQLEKIDMLELADLIVLNKVDKAGGLDALRDVRKQWKRNHNRFDASDAVVPVFPTVASRWDDQGMARLHASLVAILRARGVTQLDRTDVATIPPIDHSLGTVSHRLIPLARTRYLAEIAETVRNYHAQSELLAAQARDAEALDHAAAALASSDPQMADALRERAAAAWQALDPDTRTQLEAWPELRVRYEADSQGEPQTPNHRQTLAGTRIPRIALPAAHHQDELVRFVRAENVPGRFPFTAGVFAFNSAGEDPTRMFAGEGGPERTNRRFHALAAGQRSVRLSTAFDSVTLYGRDPDLRPDIYGKVGTSGVSICTLDDMKKLYEGFDLLSPSTSVSMTINGPAPILLAFFFNAAIDQAIEQKRDPKEALRSIRGTVQADILKEDQAQNTCIFSTEFALRLMADMQAYFIEHGVRSFYSVSVSGYHIAEAGANPVTQLAFTLANAFTYVEHYLARGMRIDDFAPSFSFFFSHGLDAEHNVLGRVARRIWAIALRDKYGASERSQKLKYHVQTSGRSLHAQEMAYNDIRTTLQALAALLDRCNSLHTNAFDEAVTTPTADSVRTALAIQLITQRELGLMQNENALQGSYLIEQLTAAVESAVLAELEAISERGGVLGAMETQYQRSKIQEESLLYETKKHSGELPIIGVNTFLRDHTEQARVENAVRSSDDEKRAQLSALAAFQKQHRDEAPLALAALQSVARNGGNVFAELMRTVRHASLGQITEALFQVGGRYRRAM